jgi:competence protein ComEC
LGNRSGRFLSALLVGQRGLLPADVREDFRRAGLAHLLAISGLHVGLLVGILWPALLLLVPRNRPRRIAVLGGFLLLFAEMTGGAAPVRRAGVMILMDRAGRLRGRSDGALRGWWLALGVEAAVRPAGVLLPGFLLSYATTLALLAGARRGWLRPARSAAGWFAVGARASAMALLASAPLQVACFGAATPWAWAHNLLLVPLAGPYLAAVVAGLLLALLPGPPGVAGWAAVDLATRGFLGLQAALAAALPTTRWGFAWGLGQALLLTALLLGLLWWGWGSWGRPALVVLLLWLGWPRPEVSWRAIFLSLGRGEAILLEWPGRPPWLVDAGPPAAPGRSAAPVASTLERLGVRRLGWVLVTHGDADHAGGLEALGTGVVADSVGTPSPEGLPRPARRIRAGWRRRPAPGIVVEALHPPPGWEAPEENDASLVLRVRGAGLSLLLTGDLERRGETRLLTSGADVRADVLKAAHHGRATSTAAPFLRRVAPRVVVRLGALPAGETAERRLEREGKRWGIPVVSAARSLVLRIRRGRWVLETAEGRLVRGVCRAPPGPSRAALRCGQGVRVL